MFFQLKSFLEKIDYYRDQLLFMFIKKFWPRYIWPNHLTILRIILSIVIVFLLVIGFRDRLWLVSLFIIGALLDMLDGSVARALKRETKIGALLDSIADRMLLLPIGVFILFKNYVWLLLFLMIPEIISGIMIVYYRTKNRIITATIFGKTKMVIECVALSVIILFDFPDTPSSFPIILLYFAVVFAFLNIVLNINALKNQKC